MKQVMWENIDTFGCELLEMETQEDAIHITSTVLALEDSGPVSIEYMVELDRSWKIRTVAIQSARGDHLQLTSNGSGEWRNDKGVVLTELAGAIDIDISATPFTNSLPINRHNWVEGQSRDFEMVYISVPSLTVQKAPQTYTLAKDGQNRIFHYRSGDFQSLVTVDEHGLVTDYPKLFTRRY